VTICVYLDQNIWVELSKARLSRPSASPDFEVAYRLARDAVREKRAVFVLSRTHFHETQKQHDWNRRLDVVETMIELSGLRSISHVTKVVPLEAQYASDTLRGQKPDLPHVFNDDLLGKSRARSPRLRLPEGVSWELIYRPSFAKLLDEYGPTRAWEILTLAGRHPGTERYRGENTLRQQVDDQFPPGQARVAEVVAGLGLRGKQLAKAMGQYTLVEVWDELAAAANGKRQDHNEILEIVATDPERLLNLMPSRYAVRAMYMQHGQQQRRWRPNDLHDFTALSVAAAYCDIVITEKHWATMLRRGGVHTRLGTQILYGAAQLVDALSSARKS